jgi:hypothetical protein
VQSDGVKDRMDLSLLFLNRQAQLAGRSSGKGHSSAFAGLLEALTRLRGLNGRVDYDSLKRRRPKGLPSAFGYFCQIPS